MSVRYIEDFKKEVVKAYMAGNKSIPRLAIDYNVAKSSVSKWVNEYKEEGLYTTSTTSESVNFCKDNNVTQSMSKAGCPYDNAPMERFYNTFKSNFYNITSFSSVEMMDELTMKYINWYNYVRPHSYNNYLTPMEARYS